MWKKIDNYRRQHHMIDKGDHVLVGLSGGADSVLLTRYLLSLREQEGIQLTAVHINHMLRGEEALRDESFVAEFCRRWEIPCFIFQEEVRQYAEEHKMSLEEAGREVRYACFEQVMEQKGCTRIAVAHHANDLAETMIFRMVRGTGPEGLCSIQPKNGKRIRPLLCVDKQEILWMLERLGQAYVDDSSNKELDYSRNYIRHRILPAMAEMNEKAIAHMGRLSEQLSEQSEYISRQMERLFDEHAFLEDGSIHMSLSFLKDCGALEQKEMIRRMIFLVGGHRKDISALHVDLVRDLLWKADGRKYNLPYGLLAIRDRDSLWIRKSENPFVEGLCSDHRKISHLVDKAMLEKEKEWRLLLEDGRELQFSLLETDYHKIQHFLKNNCVKYFDYDKINRTFCVRTRESGDYFVLDESGKHKKLKRYFIDQKIPEVERNEKILLAQEDHVLWVEGGRISHPFKVGETTERVLRLMLKPAKL